MKDLDACLPEDLDARLSAILNNLKPLLAALGARPGTADAPA